MNDKHIDRRHPGGLEVGNANHTSSPRSQAWLAWFWRLIVEAIWLMWMGGLTFYISIVVPIGGEILGAAQQGEVTGRVTATINVLGTMASIIMAIEGRLRRDRIITWLALGMLVPQVALFVLRSELIALQSHQTSWLFGQLAFYSAHRIYLWTTTLQWLLGIGITCRMAMYRSKLPTQTEARDSFRGPNH